MRPLAMTRHSLRHKLTAIFVLLAVFGGISGGVGLYYVTRISNTVTVFAETTTPMLAAMTDLIEKSLRFKLPVFADVGESDGINRLLTARITAHDEMQEQIVTLRGHVERTGADVGIDEAERLELALVEALERMIGSHARADRALANMREVNGSLRSTLAETDRRLQHLIGVVEADIAIVEERTKIGARTNATAQELGEALSRVFNVSYQVLEKSRWLSRLLKEVEDTATLVPVSTTVRQLEQQEANAVTAFRGMRNVLGLLAGRLATDEERRSLEALEAGIAGIEADMIGPGGLFAHQRKVVAAQSALTAGRREVLALETAYLKLLDEVKRAVAGLNADAQVLAASSIADAKLAFATCLILALGTAVFLANAMARRITDPLSRLTSHVAAIGESGDLAPLPDPAASARRDEIGTLTRAFNTMIEELDDARRALIAQSQEDVRIQYGRLNAAISNMPQGLSMFDGERRLVVCNDRFADLYQLAPAMTVPGTSYESIVKILLGRVSQPLTADAVDSFTSAMARIAEPHYGIYELKNGRTVAISRLPTPDGGSVATHEDITERRRAEEKIAHMAMHDMLTDLPNRVSFRKSLEAALGRMARGSEDIAVLYFDLDHFKNVNDSLGHPVGDALLRAVAHRLASCVRETDSVARLGGDEFAIVQSDLNQPGGAAELATRLVAELSRPYEIDRQQVMIGASVGIALAPADGADPDTLLRNADMALYRSKEVGRGTYSFFEAGMNARMQARRALEMELRRALAREEFALHYQPLVNARTGKVGGFEALLRWNSPDRGLVAPAAFIPIAEETGLINELGTWVLGEACAAAAAWPPELRIAVNLAPAQFVNGRILDDVRAALARSGLTPQRLELEITETMLIHDTGSTVAMLERLHELGVRISMDDFGTGYSSLGYLRRFAFDKIKIDGSFVRDLHSSRNATAIVRAVNGLAAALGIETVAEGVETGEQLASARSEGCNEVQGKLFSGPVPLAEVEDLIHREFGRSNTAADGGNERNAA